MMYSNAKQCDACGYDTTVYFTTESKDGVLKRYRRCKKCNLTFTTYEIRCDELESEKQP